MEVRNEHTWIRRFTTSGTVQMDRYPDARNRRIDRQHTAPGADASLLLRPRRIRDDLAIEALYLVLLRPAQGVSGR